MASRRGARYCWTTASSTGSRGATKQLYLLRPICITSLSAMSLSLSVSVSASVSVCLCLCLSLSLSVSVSVSVSLYVSMCVAYIFCPQQVEPDASIQPGGAGNDQDGEPRNKDDSACREMEAHEPVEDRHAAWLLVDGHKEGWDWADVSKPPPTPSLPVDPVMCVASVAAVQPRTTDLGAEGAACGRGLGDCTDDKEEDVIFPACLFRSTTAQHRTELLAAVKAWLRARAGPKAVVMGRLTNTAHPAVAAAEAFASRKQGVASVQMGLFARRSVSRCEILCEYQGVRLTSPVGCSPWRSAVPAGRTSYMLALATVAHWGGMRQALRTLPRLRVPHVNEAAEILGRRPAQALLWAEHSELLQQWCEDLTSLGTGGSAEDVGVQTIDEVASEEATESMIRTQLFLIYSEHNPTKLPKLGELIDKYGARSLLRKVTRKYLDASDSDSKDEEEDAEAKQRVDAVHSPPHNNLSR